MRRVLWNPWQRNGKLRNMKNQIIEALKSFAISKSGMQGGEAKRNLPWSILDDSHFSHFWSSSWSPIYTCYMSFRRSGSQKSNALNGAWFRVEMKELQPLGADHSKLKENFARLWNHPFVAKMLSFCCENFAAILHSAAVFSWSFPTDILRYFSLDIWCLNPQTLLVTHLS